MWNDLPKVSSINKLYSEYAATEPFFACLDNGQEVVVKYINNCEGNLVLINEYISYCIAKAMCVPTPDFGICLLDSSVNVACDFNLTTANYGPAFYTVFVKKTMPLLASGFISLPKNIESFINILLFDHIIYNKDRHPGNFLYSQDGELFAIDHSHVFKNQCIWDRFAFSQGMTNNDYLDKEILEFNQETYSILFEKLRLKRDSFNNISNLVKTNLTEEYIRSIFEKLPSCWTNDIPTEDLTHLEKYINYRISHIDDIVNMICEERGII